MCWKSTISRSFGKDGTYRRYIETTESAKRKDEKTFVTNKGISIIQLDRRC
jgi:hypothetical protein